MASRRPRGTRRARPIDMRSLGEALSHPGIDPRQWVSYGVVDAADIEFDKDYGPLIPVTLKPSEVEVTCRVAMQVAGDGEGDYPQPFVAGDEVLVAIPGGSERADCAIFGRMSNARARFPKGPVAGQDPTTNAFGFRRVRAPYLVEHAGPIMMVQATSGAFLSIDDKGTVTLRDGQAGAIQMSPDVFGWQSGDAKSLLQVDMTGGRFTLQVEDALFTMSASRASPETSAFAVPGTLTISTAANPAAEHVLTTEALANILVALGTVVSVPWTSAQVAAAITAAAAAPLDPIAAAAIFSAFGAAAQKPPPVPGQGQLKPGIGAAGLLAG